MLEWQRGWTQREKKKAATCFIYFSFHPCFFHKFSQVSLTTLCNMWNSIYTLKTPTLQHSNLSESTASREISNILLSALIKVEHIKIRKLNLRLRLVTQKSNLFTKSTLSSNSVPAPQNSTHIHKCTYCIHVTACLFSIPKCFSCLL